MTAAPAPAAAEGRTIELTAEQRVAVDARSGPLFLHAAAGSGKTSVLVERFVRAVLDDGVAVDRLLAITFTERAAAELKGRVRERLVDLGARECAREAEGAWVSTFHGFCARLLRAHPLAAGIDPEFEVLNEAEAERLGAEAFDRALEAFIAGGASADRVELVAAYSPDRLETTVRTLYGRLRSRGERRPELPEVPEPALGEVRERLDRAVRAARARLDPHRDSGPTVDAALDRLDRCAEALAALAEGEPGDPWRFRSLRVRAGAAAALRGPELEELEAAQTAWLEACAAARSVPDLRLLRSLLRLHGDRYAEAKEVRSTLDFEDLELLARDLLRSEPGLGRQVRERFTHVMVDEFQDTNRLQGQILDLVADGNVFTVGDEHQSIYRFRHADVGVFREHRAAAEAEGRAARLSTSFRSAPEILDALGLAFGPVLGPGFQPPRAPEGAGRASPAEPPRVELIAVDSDRGRWEALGDAPFGESMRGSDPWRAAEARLLARRVFELTAPGAGFRPGDVAVLVRGRADVAVYERALAERGLPTYVAGGSGYWSQQQVADLRAYLAVLANPLDEAALMSVLASPMVGASLDALVVVWRRAGTGGRGAWRALEEAFGEGGDGSDGLAAALPDADRERLAGFFRRLAEERSSAPGIPLEALIDRAVTASGYDRAVLAMPAGERRMANVRKLMRLAREHEAEAGRDLRGFIDAVDERGVGGREGEAPLEGERLDAVRLMSVHAAKGLEFPVVYVADLGRRGRHDDAALRVTDDGRVGLRVSTLGGEKLDGLELERIKAEQAAADEEEEKRVFYVACTRARERLVLSGATDLERRPPERVLGPPINWLWRAFAPDLAAGVDDGLAEGESVRSFEGRPVRVRWLACSPRTVEGLLPPGDRAPAAPDAAWEQARMPVPAPEPAPAAADPLPVSRLSYAALESHDRCGYRFYLERVLGLPAREEDAPRPLAATDGGAEPASGEGAGRPAAGARQLAFDLDGADGAAAGAEAGGRGLSALARGSVVHELLERLDFARPAAPSPEAVAERIRAGGVVPRPADVEEVRALVEGFLGSSLFRRAAATGRVRTEVPFAFPLAPQSGGGRSLLVDGVIDLHCAEAETALVVDYKSDRLGGEDLEAVCRERYATQRLVYALAALRAGAACAEVVHLFLERPEEPVAARFEAHERPRLERELGALSERVLAGRFEPTDRPHRELCAGCPGRPALCSWDLQRTGAPRPPGRAVR